MKRDSEEAISRVLAGLRNTKASVGMEHRVIQAVERRAAAQPASWLRSARFGSSLLHTLTGPRISGNRPLAWCLALGGVLAVLSFSFTTPGFMSEIPMHSAKQPTSGIAPHPGVEVEPQTLRARSLPSGSPPRAHKALPARMPVRHPPVLAVLRSTRNASRPASVAPLTQEEKLLLRVAHTGDPREMAMLNPEIRSRQAAEAEAQFKRFVEQGSKGDQE